MRSVRIIDPHPRPSFRAPQPSLLVGGELKEYQLLGVEWLVSLCVLGLYLYLPPPRPGLRIRPLSE